MQYYIAFSIHGTNAFITASTDNKKLVTDEMTPIQSRRPDANTSNETKLSWSKLNKKAGGPQTYPSHILKLFKQLELAGWKVDSQKFREHHYPTK